MIDTQNTEGQQAGPSHARKAGDTPALGLAVVPGSGGRRYAPEPERQPAAPPDGGLAVDEPVTYHGRVAWVAALYPASAQWTRPMCKIRFEDGGKPVVVGVDEVDRCITPDDLAAHQQARALVDTAPLPSPVSRILTAAQVRAELADAIEALDEQPTEALPAAEVLLEEKPAEDDRPTERLAAVGTQVGLLDVLRILGAILSWPVRRDGGRALLGRIVGGVADGVDEATDRLHDWLHAHALLLAKVIVAALSVAVLGAAGVAWLLTVVAR
ncbi:hypothetical protein SAMN04489727_1689 [Amycolatopsis tolypomycina]|uniref:Uncharacterized protein n=1 Tax=Amycolatopsis tolypomycina TaxID=208445 RepID=A0A1H4JA27_9PSEU|nr:hypothetical protein [Amycolatopsis tolypomycina]SEB43170.1 hypothetical protein SAMN04489727_1689 [Amycolatopsis tolypomycina]